MYMAEVKQVAQKLHCRLLHYSQKANFIRGTGGGSAGITHEVVCNDSCFWYIVPSVDDRIRDTSTACC